MKRRYLPKNLSYVIRILLLTHEPDSTLKSSSSSRPSDGNSSLLDEGGSASQVPQASVQLAGYGSVV